MMDLIPSLFLIDTNEAISNGGKISNNFNKILFMQLSWLLLLNAAFLIVITKYFSQLTSSITP